MRYLNSWVGMASILLDMGGHGCNLKGKCRALMRTFSFESKLDDALKLNTGDCINMTYILECCAGGPYPSSTEETNLQKSGPHF